MSIIDRLSSSMGQRDNAQNQTLAKELARTKRMSDIEELVQNLSNKNKAIQNDCMKVLYEIGYIRPELIAPYVTSFINLLHSPNNRLAWGAMIALSAVALLEAPSIFKHLDRVMEAMEHGSVITVDNGVSVLANVASTNKAYEKKIIPLLFRHLEMCRPKEVAQHAERALTAIHAGNKEDFKKVLTDRMVDISGPQQKRVKKILKDLDK
ncbi:MAG: hypothetical protein JW932_02635 [Deltaproteobacteria bacterium]|nr:hypothetical protein [Deltaproteobacteria bacterium]